MSMLARYKKPGGFVQLISLLESFGPQKREKFLEMIDAESPAWGKALRDKMISIERVMSWPEQVVSEIFRELPVRNLACAIKGLKPDQSAKIIKFLGHSEKRKLDDELGALEAKPEEIATTFAKVLDHVRKMIKQGDIRLDKFDPSMIVEDNIETTLAHEPGGNLRLTEETDGNSLKFDVGHATPAAAPAHAGGGPSINPAELSALQNSVANLSRENRMLKEEVRVLKEKLEQIKRIA